MNRSMEEITADLEKAQSDDLDGEELPAQDEEENEEEAPEEIPGYMGYEDWIAAGKDPDDYRGKNAYKAQYDIIQDNKALKGDVKELKDDIAGFGDMLTGVVSAAEDTRKAQAAAYKVELEEQLAKQKDEMDVEGALKTSREIDSLATKETPKAPEINPVITSFVADNPILDKDSADYNADFHADMIAFHDAGIDALGGGTRPITDAQIAKNLASALRKAKELNSDLFASPRNNRAGTGRGGKGGKGSNDKKLSDFKIDDTEDPRNQSAATAMYESIKLKNPAKAEEFKKRLLQG